MEANRGGSVASCRCAGGPAREQCRQCTYVWAVGKWLRRCWGYNAFSRLETHHNRFIDPGLGERPRNAVECAGSSHTCALLANGTAKCWGNNASGQLGNAHRTGSSTPVVVSTDTPTPS